ncbi:MAG TPA: 4-coumarate--CoA ligase family protein [Actinomycetota bacterium]|jgi:acyl-CoA synthetase (AMP-forming)/AMP-acid ligase II|nr:4-coumarate--CoA ligase family protein [Actinomycetota bacterium]
MAGEIVLSPHPDVTVSGLPLHEFVLADALRLGDQPALIDGPSGRTLTYRQLAGGVRRVAAGLAARGFGKGDVFAIFSPNLPEYALAFYGVAAAGGVNTTISPLYTADELARQLQDSGARFLLTVPPFLDKALDAAGRSGVEEVFVLGEGEGATPFTSLLTAGDTPPDVEIDPASDLVALPYSSGTTGMPKGVMLTHRNLVANLCQGVPALLAGEGERLIAVLPFFHIYGLVVLMAAALSRGSTLVTMPRFDLEQFLGLLQDQRITRAYLAPPIVLALAKHPLVDNYDLSALQSVFSGAAPLDASLERACAERLGCDVMQGWGLTETSPVVTSNHNTPKGPRPGSVGVPLPNTEMRVVDPATGADVSRGETGELLVRGPQVMKGYLNAPDATAAMLDPDGWLHTGDLGRIDEAGYVFIVDRVKELIKYKGLQVAPAELEAVLLTHPAVADAAVVPFPDDEAGEVPKAFVVARGQVDADELLAFVAERVAPHKKVRQLEFVEEIPKAASGKILRRVLIERDRQATG